MPSASGEVKVTKKDINSSGNSESTGSAETKKKKKRPRHRIRSRNKAVREAAANANLSSEAGTSIGNPIENLIPPHLIGDTDVEKRPGNIKPLVDVKLEKTELTVNLLTKETTETEKANVENKSYSAMEPVCGKTREQVMAEREAKKLAKQAKKTKVDGTSNTPPTVNAFTTSGKSVIPALPVAEQSKLNNSGTSVAAAVISAEEKSREQIKAEREAKKQAKHAVKAAKTTGVAAAAMSSLAHQVANVKITTEYTQSQLQSAADPADTSALSEEKKKPALSKAERRAIQEAQRAAKTQMQAQKLGPTSKLSAVATLTKANATSNSSNVIPQKAVTPRTASTSSSKKSLSPAKCSILADRKVKLFNHLECAGKDVNLFVNNTQIHPSIVRLGEQYAKRTIVGSNARCVAFLNALKKVIQDFETPPKKEFARSLETSFKYCVEHLQKCRPLAVSVSNAHKHIKHVLTQLPTDQPETELKLNLCHFIDTYIENQIEKAAQAISSKMQEKISNDDVILTFGCSSLISYICEEAKRRLVNFRVIIVDSRPFCEGQEQLRRLNAKEIPCTYVLINALGYVMPEATKVLLGAHALLSNGYVMARTGTAQVALVARSSNVPVLVCCETHKFSERFQTDAIVYNELGNPDDLILNDKCCLANWQAKSKMTPLNLMYDITPPELVTAVVTEVSILPCTSVPVILRIKPTEIGYYN